jgi:hypothetical protein
MTLCYYTLLIACHLAGTFDFFALLEVYCTLHNPLYCHHER